jgi:predicted peptidase
MIMRAKPIAILGLCLLGQGLAAEPSRGGGPVQTVHRFNKKADVSLEYLLYLPPEYHSQRQKAWPLLLFLHGAGEQGSNIEKVKDAGLPEMLEKGTQLPFIVVSPQCPVGDAWDGKLKALTELLDDVSSHYRVDPDRVYLTGLSMGGFGAWALAAYAPDRFAAVIPICGGGELSSVPRLKKLPIWAFHGAKDDIVPIEQTRQMVDALKKANGNVKFTVYPNARHDSWTATYENPEVYKWLLDHKRAVPEKKPR